VNGRVMPKVLSSHDPTRPRLPNARSKAMPPTTGGRTMGRVAKARRRFRPGNSTRAKTQASGTPRTSPMAVADSDAISDSFRASMVSGAVSDLTASPHGERTMRPSRGRMKNAAPIAARTATTIGTRSALTLAYAGRKPKDCNFAWPSADRTNPMKALARSAFLVPLTGAIGYVAITFTASGIRTPCTLLPAAEISVV
jgi:hypothetical protein